MARQLLKVKQRNFELLLMGTLLTMSAKAAICISSESPDEVEVRLNLIDTPGLNKDPKKDLEHMSTLDGEIEGGYMRGLYATVDAETKKSLKYEKSIGEMKNQVRDLEARLKTKKEELEAYKEREKCSQID